MYMHLPGTVGKTYSDELFAIINKSSELPEIIKSDPKWGINFIFGNLKVLGEIDELEREIKAVLGKLGVAVNVLFSKAYSIEELVIGIKQYLIAWSTMKDLMAILINTSLDLGIHENDISFGMMLRNQKVTKTDVPTICGRHSNKIDVPYTDKQRNDAIHRGKLLDDEINEFRNRHSHLFSQRYSLLALNPISDDEFKRGLEDLNTELSKLVELKRAQYSKHFELTLDLNKDLAKELARLSAQTLANVRI